MQAGGGGGAGAVVVPGYGGGGLVDLVVVETAVTAGKLLNSIPGLQEQVQATANTGGGGGGGGPSMGGGAGGVIPDMVVEVELSAGASGGSGIVIIRYKFQ